jgi:hypothetical protein
MASSHAKKVVLIASQPYSAQLHEPLLLSLLERRIVLFSATGVDCENWETAFDLLLTDPDRHFTHHVTTTSHPDEPIADVINMADLWFVEGGSEVEVLEV